MFTRIRTNTRRNGEGGFTLLEIIVVLAVIGLLGAALMPMVLGYLEDAKKSKAEAEVRVIAAALVRLTRDLGHYPSYKGTKSTGTADIELLCGPGDLPTKAGGASGWLPTSFPTGACANQTTVSTLEDVLIKNQPLGLTGTTDKFNTDRGKTGGLWKGPYEEKFQADPWGRSYVVNIANGETEKTGGLRKVIWVLSAGPNGEINTAADSAIDAQPFPTDDDIALRIK